MSSRNRTLISIALSTLALIGLGYYLYRNWADVTPLLDANPVLLVVMLLLLLVQMWGQAACNWLMFKTLGSQVNLLECFWLGIVSNTANSLLPAQPGAAVRAVYLKKVHQLEFAHFSSAFFAFQIVDVVVVSTIYLVLYLTRAPKNQFTTALAIFAFVVIAVCLATFLLPKIKQPRNRFFVFFVNAWDGWHQLKSKPKTLVFLVLGVFLIRAIDGIVFYVACAAVGLEVGFDKALMATSLAAVFNAVKVTPGNIGIQESVYGMLSSIVGVSSVQCVTISLLIRTITIVRSVLILPIALHQLNRRTSAG